MIDVYDDDCHRLVERRQRKALRGGARQLDVDVVLIPGCRARAIDDGEVGLAVGIEVGDGGRPTEWRRGGP